VIVEMRTYSLRPGFLGRALERIALGVEERTRLSPLGGLWYSDIGRRHQIVHLWPYDSLAHRDQVRGSFGGLKNWPARTTEFTAESETKIMSPAPFSPALAPGKKGPVYEICTDTCRPEAMKDVAQAWSAVEKTHLIGAWQTTLGPMYQWIHIWAYRSFEERTTFKQELPGDPDALFLKQESGIYYPAAFSPLQ
jgi:hypothetical protein